MVIAAAPGLSPVPRPPAGHKRRSGHDPIRRLRLADLRPAPENDQLYKPIDSADPEIIALAQSISKHGIQEPLIVTADQFIISGHRRYAAAKLAGLEYVPCRVREDVSRWGTPELFLTLLRESNRQRIKSLDEMLREEVVSATPHEAYASLIEYRRKAAAIEIDTMELGERRRRAQISEAKWPMLAAVLHVIDAMKDFWPLSDRQIHYQLLNDPPLIHASKAGSRYKNDKPSYKALVDLLARGRLTGLIAWDVIADETRPVVTWSAWRDPQAFMRHELDGLFKEYWRDRLQSQPNHIELLVEKNTVLPVLKPIAAEHCLPITSGRGFCSLPPRHAMAKRYKASGKTKLVLLIVSDLDPEGQTIAESFARSMRDDFDMHGIEATKVALTADQVEIYGLPPGLKAKAGSATREKFVAEHGEHVYELEALPPAELQLLTREAIDSVLDVEAWNAEVEKEAADAAFLDTARRRAIAAMREGGAL